MNSLKINNDQILNSIIANRFLKVPIYNELSTVGDNSGMRGDIILNQSDDTFYGHNGITWIPFSGGGPPSIENLQQTLAIGNFTGGENMIINNGDSILLEGKLDVLTTGMITTPQSNLGPLDTGYIKITGFINNPVGNPSIEGGELAWNQSTQEVYLHTGSGIWVLIGGTGFASILNVGGGREIYKSLTSSPFELRTLISNDPRLIITQNTDTIEFNLDIDLSGGSIQPLINIGTGEDIYNTTSPPGVSELRRLRGNSSSVFSSATFQLEDNIVNDPFSNPNPSVDGNMIGCTIENTLIVLVSPSGNDENDGIFAPVQTLDRAFEIIRLRNFNQVAEIQLSSGVHIIGRGYHNWHVGNRGRKVANMSIVGEVNTIDTVEVTGVTEQATSQLIIVTVTGVTLDPTFVGKVLSSTSGNGSYRISEILPGNQALLAAVNASSISTGETFDIFEYTTELLFNDECILDSDNSPITWRNIRFKQGVTSEPRQLIRFRNQYFIYNSIEFTKEPQQSRTQFLFLDSNVVHQSVENTDTINLAGIFLNNTQGSNPFLGLVFINSRVFILSALGKGNSTPGQINAYNFSSDRSFVNVIGSVFSTNPQSVLNGLESTFQMENCFITDHTSNPLGFRTSDRIQLRNIVNSNCASTLLYVIENSILCTMNNIDFDGNTIDECITINNINSVELQSVRITNNTSNTLPSESNLSLIHCTYSNCILTNISIEENANKNPLCFEHCHFEYQVVSSGEASILNNSGPNVRGIIIEDSKGIFTAPSSGSTLLQNTTGQLTTIVDIQRSSIVFENVNTVYNTATDAENGFKILDSNVRIENLTFSESVKGTATIANIFFDCQSSNLSLTNVDIFSDDTSSVNAGLFATGLRAVNSSIELNNVDFLNQGVNGIFCTLCDINIEENAFNNISRAPNSTAIRLDQSHANISGTTCQDVRNGIIVEECVLKIRNVEIDGVSVATVAPTYGIEVISSNATIEEVLIQGFEPKDSVGLNIQNSNTILRNSDINTNDIAIRCDCSTLLLDTISGDANAVGLVCETNTFVKFMNIPAITPLGPGFSVGNLPGLFTYTDLNIFDIANTSASNYINHNERNNVLINVSTVNQNIQNAQGV